MAENGGRNTQNIMRLIYIANIRLPTEKAHGIQIMKMCEAFAEKDIDVELLVPARRNDLMDDPFEFYGIKRIFRIKKLPCLDILRFNFEKIGFLISTSTFLTAAKLYLAFKDYDILYTRERFTGIFFKNCILEIHALPKRLSRFFLWLLRQPRFLVVITKYAKEKLVAESVPVEKIMVLPDAVDIKEFDLPLSKTEARKKLNLPSDKTIVLYTGSFLFYGWKGVGSLLEAGKLLKDDFLFVLVGGHPWEIEKLKEFSPSPNILLVPYQKHGLIPYYLKSADIFVLPNEKGEEISERYTSPLKLFEYMASKRPIISSDLPSLREVLTDKEALFFEAGNQRDLAGAIRKVSENPELAGQLSYNAYEKVKEYTWDKRAKKIIKILSENYVINR